MHKSGPSQTPPQAPSAYDLDFRREAIPRLRAGATRLAVFAARGDVSFAEAHDALADVAIKLGADRVSDFDSLMEYLDAVLAERIAELAP